MQKASLFSIPEGSSAVIESLEVTGLNRRRLLDLGFTPGTKVSCLFSAPSGNPRAYMIRGTVIALRDKDAKAVYLKCGNAEKRGD